MSLKDTRQSPDITEKRTVGQRGQDEQGNFFRQLDTKDRSVQVGADSLFRPSAYSEHTRVVDMQVTLKHPLTSIKVPSS